MKPQKALTKRLQKSQQLQGATFIVCFAMNRKTRLMHPIIELRIWGQYEGDLCACTLYGAKGEVTMRLVLTHVDDRLHRIAAKIMAATGTDVRKVKLTKYVADRPYDPEYEYSAEPKPRKHTITIGEARSLTSKAAKNQAVRALRECLRAVEKPPPFVILNVPHSQAHP